MKNQVEYLTKNTKVVTENGVIAVKNERIVVAADHNMKFDSAETIDTQAAADGATTLVEILLSASPVINTESFCLKGEIISNKSIVDCALWGALSRHSVGDFEELHECGCTAYKDFTPFVSPDYPYVEDCDLLQAMEQIKQVGGDKTINDACFGQLINKDKHQDSNSCCFN